LIIDFHAHFTPRALLATSFPGDPDRAEWSWHGIRLRRESGGRVAVIVGDGGERSIYPTRLSLEDRLRDMDAAGVDLQVLTLRPSLFDYREDATLAAAAASEVNQELSEVARRWPDRLAGLAHLPLQDPDAAIAELEHAVGTLGLAGAGVHSHVDGINWDSDRLFPILAAAERLGVPLFFHPTRGRLRDTAPHHHLPNLIGNPCETTIAIASLIFGGVLDRLPELEACFAHGGGYAAFAAGRFDHGYRVRKESQRSTTLPSDYLRRLSYDCITHSHAALRYLLDTVGSANVVLGTDYPADMGIERPLDFVNGCQALSSGEKQAILSDNPRRLLGLGST
jgi:aminocarboxymuconate-semialdehyde decarboxylase